MPAGRKGAYGCKSLAWGLGGRLRPGRRAPAGALWPGQGRLTMLARVFNQGNSRPMGSSVHGHLSVHSQHGRGGGGGDLGALVEYLPGVSVFGEQAQRGFLGRTGPPAPRAEMRECSRAQGPSAMVPAW